MKMEATCKECGRIFVKYAYSRMARCEECRKNRPLAAVGHSGNADEHPSCPTGFVK
jgi:hypothetical protein